MQRYCSNKRTNQQINMLMSQKQKLDLLRKQVTMKKQQKQMNKTATSVGGSKGQNDRLLRATTKTNNQYNTVDVKLKAALQEMKMGNLEQKLREKGVKSFEKLIELKDDEIDSWKDLLVGYRIKLKKFIKSQSNQKTDHQITTRTTNNPPQLPENASNYKQKQKLKPYQHSFTTSQINPLQMHNSQHLSGSRNIQQIIKQRQLTKVFIPLERQSQLIEDLYLQNQLSHQLQEYQSQVLFQSFLKTFNPRKPILKSKIQFLPNSKFTLRSQNLTKIPENKNILKKQHIDYINVKLSNQKKVHWAKQVQMMQRQFQKKSHRQYPKQHISKQALVDLHYNQNLSQTQKILEQKKLKQRDQKNQKQKVKFCWKCFRKINLSQNINFNCMKQIQNLKYFCSDKCFQMYNQEISLFISNVQQKNCNNQNENSCEVGQNDRPLEIQEQDLEILDLSIL